MPSRSTKTSASKNSKIIDALTLAYNAEIETMMNYLAASNNLDGVRAKQIAAALAADIQEEFGHAQLLAKRIKTVGGIVQGSMKFKATQKQLQPTHDTTDVIPVIRGVIAAEEDAIKTYQMIIDLCEGEDYATQDLAIKILADEEQHKREFVGFMKEYQKK